MDWTSRLRQAIEYLEDGLDGNVEIEIAAGLANCSHFHFCRMFEVVFGTSPAEYVRRRRLSRAALDLAAGGDKVLDVALRYGWDSPESFTKAFKRCFGIAPSQAKQHGFELEIWPPMELAVIVKGDKTVKYRIEKKDKIELTGVMLRTTNTENQNLKRIPLFWSEKSQDGSVELLAKQVGPMGLFGICYDYKAEDNSFSYAIAVEKPVQIEASLPSDCVSITAPPATYAVFECLGPMPDAIQQTWKEIYAEWFPSSEYEHSGDPDFEIYPEQEDPELDGSSPEYRTEIWIPIKKKTNK